MRRTQIRFLSQLELEGFAEKVQPAVDGGEVLSAAEIHARSMAAKLILETDEVPVYFEPYHRLINAGVPWRVAAFVAWSSVPRPKRQPATQDEFARMVLGLTSDRVIAEWRKNYPIDQMIADMQGEALMQYRPGVFDAIGWGASQKDYKAAAQQRLFVELTRDMPDPRMKIEVNDGQNTVDDLMELTNDELDVMEAGLAREMLKKIRTQQKNVEDGDAETGEAE